MKMGFYVKADREHDDSQAASLVISSEGRNLGCPDTIEISRLPSASFEMTASRQWTCIGHAGGLSGVVRTSGKVIRCAKSAMGALGTPGLRAE